MKSIYYEELRERTAEEMDVRMEILTKHEDKLYLLVHARAISEELPTGYTEKDINERISYYIRKSKEIGAI